jgi:hypothetical protein
MRTLLYVPVIHSIADMGSLGEELQLTSASRIGEAKWQRHVETVNHYWENIEACLERNVQDAGGMKLYKVFLSVLIMIK